MADAEQTGDYWRNPAEIKKALRRLRELERHVADLEARLARLEEPVSEPVTLVYRPAARSNP